MAAEFADSSPDAHTRVHAAVKSWAVLQLSRPLAPPDCQLIREDLNYSHRPRYCTATQPTARHPDLNVFVDSLHGVRGPPPPGRAPLIGPGRLPKLLHVPLVRRSVSRTLPRSPGNTPPWPSRPAGALGAHVLFPAEPAGSVTPRWTIHVCVCPSLGRADGRSRHARLGPVAPSKFISLTCAKGVGFTGHIIPKRQRG